MVYVKVASYRVKEAENYTQDRILHMIYFKVASYWIQEGGGLIIPKIGYCTWFTSRNLEMRTAP
jgi:hypothetical protein